MSNKIERGLLRETTYLHPDRFVILKDLRVKNPPSSTNDIKPLLVTKFINDNYVNRESNA
jgi:hypothetical protein